jgi:hypothetical protein
MPTPEKTSPRLASSQPDFAHPAEKTFSTILDYYGIEWEYEPRTFPLDWDEEHNITEAFSPYFYLPLQDLYIELTTLRPKLVNHKNRKIRRMKELYPEIQVRLVKRREMRDLMIKFGLESEAQEIIGDEAQNIRSSKEALLETI